MLIIIFLSNAFLVYSASHVIYCKGTLKSGCQGNIPFPTDLSRVIAILSASLDQV
jgi:hypothetical protein